MVSSPDLIANHEPTGAPVYLVDDDEALRSELAELLEMRGFRVATFQTGLDLLAAAKGLEAGCILLDYNMPRMNGLDVLQKLGEKGLPHKVVILTGHGQVSIAVTAMQRGAVDFLEKPIRTAELLPAITLAQQALAAEAGSRSRRQDARERIERLSRREIEVLRAICEGKPNKIVAYELDLSIRTVENHRGNIMAKTEAGSLAEILRLAISAGLLDHEEV